MEPDLLGCENAVWDDGEWVSWQSINSHLARLELEAQYPKANVELVPIFEEMVNLAHGYNLMTGRHLSIYGDIGELFGAIHFGIELHKNYAMGSDGRMGNDFVEIKTITPFKNSHNVTVRLDRHFNKLLVVRIDESFSVSGLLVARSKLPKVKSSVLTIGWDSISKLVD